MKFYYYLIISIGIMLTLAIAGVDGIGTNVRTLMIDNNVSLIQPETQYNGTISDSTDEVYNDITSSSTNLWRKFLVAMIAMALLGAVQGVQVLGSGITFDGTRLVKGAIAYVSFGFFTSDMWSLVTQVFSYGIGWISWFLGVIITVYIVGFAVTCIEFTGGSD